VYATCAAPTLQAESTAFLRWRGGELIKYGSTKKEDKKIFDVKW